MTQYYQHLLTRDGGLANCMYASGTACASVELARQLPGDMRRPNRAKGERVAIVSREPAPGRWTDSAGHSHQRWEKPVVIELLPEEEQ